MREIHRCYHCGMPPTLRETFPFNDNDNGYSVSCDECEKLYHRPTIKEAVAAWNKDNPEKREQ
jgi:hypothetical protein